MIEYDAQRWTDHLFDLRGSVIREIAARVLLCTLFAAIVLYVDVTILTPRNADLEIPPTAHTLIGTALGLLLVFRTNSSYDRFWEGRKQWGAIVNETRNLARASSVLLAADPALVRELARWTVSFAWATKHQLRSERGLGPLGPSLPPKELQDVLAAAHTPLAVSRRMSALLAQGRRRGLIGDVEHMALDQNVQQLIDYMGACERIQKTPLPYAYAVHLRRAMIAFCFTLPFVLVHSFHWATIPATFLVSYTFFGIEEIGVEIENPFGHDENDLPLEKICETIQRDVLDVAERVAETAPAPSQVPA
jgi:ion channel-forming bestrophin family protein